MADDFERREGNEARDSLRRDKRCTVCTSGAKKDRDENAATNLIASFVAALQYRRRPRQLRPATAQQ